MGKNVVDMTIRANMDVSQLSAGISQIQGILQKLNLPPEVRKQFNSLIGTATSDLEKFQSKLQSGFKTKGDITGFEKISSNLQKSLANLEAEWNKLRGMDISQLMKLDSSSVAKIKEIENSFKQLSSELQSKLKPNLQKITTQLNNLTTASSKKAGNQIKDLLGAGQYEQAAAAIEQYIVKQQKAISSFGEDNKGHASRQRTLDTYNAIKETLTLVIAEVNNFNQSANNLQSDRMRIMAEATKEANTQLQQGSALFGDLTNKAKTYSNSMQQSAQKTVELGYDLDMLKSRVQYFFSLTNSVMLFRRILQDTIQTTKELDAAMTETAVVTDFSVADMWKELPRYTKLAKDLGATIQGVYETMTLYYQQGLKTEEVVEVGTETLKMARIAGLDYAKATDFMTAALRGFNMEINEVNAQKINDVYSNLAAITAADTKEIATAMTKTASIASNANMEFETTAAFLSQIIETTRESAETAGTAMKTVIARFTELKKDPAEIGEVDGEIVDANKIETALRTIDVALRDTNGQFRDLDDVFLDIAAKWDGLDTNTQRYIATMAAGSRQQSRFIAMMSDYGRTMELVNAANNSAGASQRQFDKTLESLEAKLNRLKDAWDQFTMGIANNTLIKGGIDALTGLLNIINKLTEHLPGATKGIANLLLMIGGFVGGKKIFDAFFASTLTNIKMLSAGGAKAGVVYGKSFREALAIEFAKTGKTLSGIKGAIFGTKIVGPDFEKSIGQLTMDYQKEASKVSGPMGMQFFVPKSKEAIEAHKKLNNEIALRETYLKASTAQQTAYNTAVAAGITQEEAKLLLINSDISATAKDIAVKQVDLEIQKEGIFLTEAERAAKIKELETLIIEQTYRKKGLIGRIAYATQQKVNILLENKEIQGKKRAILIWLQEKTAIQATTAEMWKALIPMAALVAAIGLVVGGLILFVDWAKKQTLDYKMEKAAEATEKAAEAANQAKKAYDELNSSIEELKSAEQNIDNLTQGTLEWQQAVLELNKQILELIDQFPELRSQLLNELQVEANGKLSLSDTGYNLIKQQSNERYKNAIAGQSISATQEAFLRKEKGLQDFNNYNLLVKKIDETTKKVEKAGAKERVTGPAFGSSATSNSDTLFNPVAMLSSFNDGAKKLQEEQLDLQEKAYRYTTTEDALVSISQEDKDKLYSKYIENPKIFIEENEELKNFATILNTTSQELLKFVPAMRQRREAELEYEAAVRAQAQQLILGTTSDTFKNRKDSSGISDTFADFFVDKQEDLVTQEISTISGKGNDLTEYAEQLGIQNFVNQGTTTKSLEKLYQELTGSTKEQVEEMFGGNKKELREAIARIKVGKDWGKKVENFAKELDTFGRNLSDIDKKALTDLFGGANGAGLTKGSLDQFKKYRDTDLVKVYNGSKTLQEQFDSKDSFVEWAREQVSQAELVFSDAKTKLSSLGISIDNFNEKLSADAIEGISNKLEEVFYKGGDSSKLAEQFNEIVGTLDPEKANQFASALNAIDWSSITDLEGLSNTLYEMGIYVDKTKLDTFTDNIIDFNDAIRKVDLSQLTTQLENAQSLIENISDRERGEREFTKEEMELLTSGEYGVSSDLFVGYGDKWQYVGTSLDALTQALQKNTEATLMATSKELEKQIEIANKATAAQEEAGVDLSGYGTLSSEQRQELLGNFLNTLGEAETFGGYNVDKLRGLAEAKDLDSAQQDFLNGLLEILANAIGTEDSLVAQKESTERGLGFLQYGGKSSTEIASVATQTETTENAVEIKNATDALLYKAAAYAKLEDEIRAYNDAVARGEKEQEKAIKKDIASQIAIEERAEALDDLDDKVEEHIKGLKKTNKETDAYKEGLADLTEDLNDAFDMDLDSTFLSDDGYENLKLLEQAMKGSQSAWNQLIQNMMMAKYESEDFATEYGLMGQDVSAITAALNGLSFNINGTADVTQLVTALFNAGKTGEEVARFLEELSLTNIQFKVDGNLMNLEDITDPSQLQGRTMQIHATNVNIPAARRGSSFGSGGPNTGSKSGGSGGGGSDKPWENPYDSFYNITEDLNDLLEKRNDLEQEYDEILQNENATVNDFIENYKDRLQSYQAEIDLQNQIFNLRKKEQQDILKKNSDLSKYAWIENGKVQIDFKKIDKVTDEELGQRIEDYIDSLEKNTEEINKAEDAVREAKKAAEDLIDEWEENTADFEREVFDAIVAQREKEIEEMEGIAESFDTASQDLVSAIQEEIESRRQDRENQETENDILDKERRLAFLQQDTSGAYDQEILQLQKELAEQKEDYTDTLIDQKISELEKQNDEAAKQREKQIQIAQSQLKYDQESGVIAKRVKELLDGTSGPGKGNWNAIMDLLMDKEGFKGLTSTEQEIWKNGVHKNFKSALAFLQSGGKENLATLLKNSGQKITNNYNYYGNDNKNKKSSSSSSSSGSSSGSSNGTSQQKLTKGDKTVNAKTLTQKGTLAKTIEFAEKSSMALARYYAHLGRYKKIDNVEYLEISGMYYKASDLKFKTRKRGDQTLYTSYLPQGTKGYQYKTGGLADYTGPAWLDGTKSKPELVLNQKDTQNFLQLKDILSNFMKNRNGTVNNSQVGDTNYEISITVEQMNSDYDVEQVANKIKQMISSDALYRNSNLVSRLR